MRAAAIAGVPGMDDPYETLRDLTRGRRIGADDVRTFVAGLGLPADATAVSYTHLTLPTNREV